MNDDEKGESPSTVMVNGTHKRTDVEKGVGGVQRTLMNFCGLI
jgi:hypothetical protein